MKKDDIERELFKIKQEQNNRPVTDFEGFSPNEMNAIIYETFQEGCPIQLNTLTTDEYLNIPLLNQIKYLAGLIAEAGELKLTKLGSLPVKVVKDLYGQGFMKDEFIETGFNKLYKENDCMSVHLTRILIELTGIVKKRNGKMSLTQAGKKVLPDSAALLRLLLTTFGSKYNMGYFDGFKHEHVGQVGYGYSLFLLAKYGDEKQLDNFYASKYFRAFPALLDTSDSDSRVLGSKSSRCYSIRTFDRFLDYFGLIKIESNGNFIDPVKHITRTELLEQLIDLK